MAGASENAVAPSPRASVAVETLDNSGSRVELRIALGIAVVLWIWLTRDIWKPGLPLGADVGAHVVRAEEFVQWYVPNGQLDGWQDRFGTGYQASLFLGPGFSMLTGVVRLVTLGRLDAVASVKVVSVAMLAGQSLALAAVGRAAQLSRRASGLAAVLAVLVSSVLGGAGLGGIFGVGLLPQQAATVYLLLFLAVVLTHLRRPTVTTVCAGAALIALLLMTHPVTSALAGMAAVGAVVSSTIARAIGRGCSDPSSGADPEHVRSEHRVVLMAGGLAAIALGVGMASVVVIPMMAHANLRGQITFFDHKAFIDGVVGVWDGSFVYPPLLAIVVLFGWVALIPRLRQRDEAAMVVVLVPVALGVQVWAARSLFELHPLFVQLPNRSWGLLGLLCLLPASASIAEALRSVASTPLSPASISSDPRGFGARARRVRTAVPGLGLAIAVAIILGTEPVGGFTPGIATPTPSLQAIGEVLRAEVPDSGRFVVQRAPRDEGPKTGVYHPDFWLVWASGTSSLNAFNPESSLVDRLLYLGDDLSDEDPEAAAGALRRLRTSHVVFMEPERFPRLLGSRHFRTVWAFDGLVVALVVPSSEEELASEAKVSMRSISPGHRVVTVDSPRAEAVALGITWSPKWVAYSDDVRVSLRENASHLLTVDAPAGTWSIELRYESDGWDTLGRCTTLMSTIVVFGAWLWTVVRRRRAEDHHVVAP